MIILYFILQRSLIIIEESNVLGLSANFMTLIPSLDFADYEWFPWSICKDTTESNTSASYLDLLLSIGRDGQLRTSLYDKRDDFNFHITNFPFLSSNIPSSPAYGVFISQLIRYARACSSYDRFILRAMRLSNKLLGQGYVKERLKSSLRKFYGRYGDLTKQYEVPLSRMLHDILDDDHIQWHPPLIGHYTNFWPLLIWTLLPNLTFYLIVQGFHRTYATGAACQQRTLTPPDTWSCPTLGLACVLMSRPISPELVLSPDFWISNTPRYFSFAFATDVACQQGTLTLPDTWFRPPLWDLLVLQLLRPDSSNLPCLYSTFHLEYPLVLSRFCLKLTWTDINCTRLPPYFFCRS